MDLKLEGQVVVVTGGVSGIGRAIVEEFLRESVHVAIWDRTENVSSLAEQIAGSLDLPNPPRCLGVRVDITSAGDVQNAINETVAELGGVDHLVHAAAIGSGRFGFPFTNLTPDDWSRVLDVNVMGTTRVAHAVAPVLVERRGGTMTLIASVAGQIGSPTDPPYSASKAANINFAQCMAKDLAPHRVRVNVICPGMVKTPLNRGVWQAWHDQQAEADRLDYDTWAQQKIKQVCPLGSWQAPADIANMAVFLASNRAAQVTGQTINVDGGFVMHW